MGDYYNIINTAVEEATKRALEEGRAEGMEKGMEKERFANAAKLKELGVDVNIISQATGLLVEEILKLQA
jgi:predicted transposase/invertase (TIGR01784 family)